MVFKEKLKKKKKLKQKPLSECHEISLFFMLSKYAISYYHIITASRKRQVLKIRILQ